MNRLNEESLNIKEENNLFKRCNSKFGILLDDKIEKKGHTLYRIVALTDSVNGRFKPYDLGGYIEEESNLDKEGSSWIDYTSLVYDKARVLDNAYVRDNSVISNNSEIIGNVIVSNNCNITNNTIVTDNSVIENNVILDFCKVTGESLVCNNVKVIKSDIVSSSIQSTHNKDLVVEYSKIVLSYLKFYGRVYNTTIGSNSSISLRDDGLSLFELVFPSDTSLTRARDLLVIREFLKDKTTVIVRNANKLVVSYGADKVDVTVKIAFSDTIDYKFNIEEGKLSFKEEEMLMSILHGYFLK